MSALAVDAPAPVNATRFRAAHATDWERLDALVTRIEKRSVRALDDDELLALPRLYRTTLSSLSVARETSLDRALVAYLEQLSARAYFQIYGVPTSAWRQLGGFLLRGWPHAVQAIWRETLAAALLTLVGTLVGLVLVRHDPTTFYSIIPDALSHGRDPSASAASLRATLYGNGGEDMLTTFATSLFTHNAQIAIFAFALGFAFAVPTVLLVAYNGLMLGAIFAVFSAKGLASDFGGWLIIHGSTEIFAIIISGAAGTRIGRAIAFPGEASRLDAAASAGRAAAKAMAGAVAMLAIAGLLEGIGRQTVQSEGLRYLIGLAVLAGWLLYFYLPRGAMRWPFRIRRDAPPSLRRSFVTPEGVNLWLELGGAGMRASAFLLDALAMLLLLIAVTIGLVLLLKAAHAEIFLVIWLIGAFVLRNGWFVLFEMGNRGATPGKRVMGLRVVARDGARLTGGAVIARNAMREIEVFLPLSFLGYQSAQGVADGFLTLFALLWSGIFLLFPLFNRDRLRVGDLVGGTWVIGVARGSLAGDIAAASIRRSFTPAALDLYGIYELQTLEEVLRGGRADALAAVAASVRRKAGLADDGDDQGFLADYYAALCARLERELSLGRRRESKYVPAAGARPAATGRAA